MTLDTTLQGRCGLGPAASSRDPVEIPGVLLLLNKTNMLQSLDIAFTMTIVATTLVAVVDLEWSGHGYRGPYHVAYLATVIGK